MIILDSTSKSLEVVLAGPPATQLPFTSGYSDTDPTASPQVLDPGANDGTTNSTTAVTMVAAPSGTNKRGVDFLSLVNDTGAGVTATIQLNNGGTSRKLVTVALAIGDQLTYTGRDGWAVLDSLGNRKQTAATGAGAAIGSPVGGATTNSVLFIDASANLAQDSTGFIYGGTGDLMISTGGGLSAHFNNTGKVLVLADTTRSVTFCNGTEAAIFDSGAGTSARFGHASYGAYIQGQLWIDQTAAATTLGTVVSKLPVYDLSGSIVGYAPVYDAIT